ncbi:MAG: hypothetical protein KatS3mg129_1183 [Leptospiraceae bacterium]|nr:MAG: hypothetical protein KatS3mg129_1183 [Leptospiraceae bacterium]
MKNYFVVLFLFYFILCAGLQRKEIVQEADKVYPQEQRKTYYQKEEYYNNNINQSIVQKQENINNYNIPKKRQIIYESKLNIQVKKIKESIEQINTIVKSYKGYIDSSNIEQEDTNAYLKIRIPVDKFFDALDKLFKIGKVTSHSIMAEDISRKLQDIESRLKTLKQLRERLYNIFKKADKVEEKAKILKEINRLTSEIEDLEARQKYLKDKATYSTIEIFLSTKEKEENNLIHISPFFWIKNLDPLTRTIYNKEYPFYEELLLWFTLRRDTFENIVDSLKIPANFYNNKENFFRNDSYVIYSPTGVGVRVGLIKNEPEGTKDFWIYAIKEEFIKRNYLILSEKKDTNLNYINIQYNDGVKQYYYTVGVFIKNTLQENYIVVIEIFYPQENDYEKHKKIIGELF